MKYLAHSSTENNPEGQKLKDHLEHTAQLAELFSQAISKKDGRLCGLYHDIGKYSMAFQRRLAGSAETVDHSSAGALLMFEHRNIFAAMCIAGHHAGLADIGTKNDLSDTFMGRINRAKAGALEDYSAWRSELPDCIPSGCENRPGIGNYFYTKMLFSALTDADWLDTEAYFRNQPVVIKSTDFAVLREKLDSFVSKWWDVKSEINIRRCHILRSAIEHGKDVPGLFSLTVPTGGGKTVSSMAFALNHALRFQKKRIIYVIPYCSILEQTQDVFEEIFGKQPIIAHYSGAEYEKSEDTESTQAFSTENWEAPVILTTAVQFFESLYSNRPGKNRKLHNIAESVIIFDEAQMLPVSFLRPCVAGICSLVDYFGCSAVLCTATQPALGQLINDYSPCASVREICPEPEQMYQQFRRVQYKDDGLLSDAELIDQLRVREQVLCVVNSRRQAQSLFQSLSDMEGSFHLSTMMIPHDRKTVLNEVRNRLKSGKPCRVVSTSLIEAGVDVDFPEVFRALAGLDSIIQAGGRCNREGKRPTGESTVHIFQTDAKAPRMLEQNISAALRVIRSFAEPDSPETIQAYFSFLFYTLKDDKQLDEKEILSYAKELRFRTIAERFHIIDGADYTIYIPTGEGAVLAKELRVHGPNRELLRKLGQYSVAVYRKYFEDLLQGGVLEPISDKAGILLNTDLYSSETGLPFSIPEQNQALII